MTNTWAKATSISTDESTQLNCHGPMTAWIVKGVTKPAQLAGRKRPRTSSSGSTTSSPLSPLSSLPSSPILQETTHLEQQNRASNSNSKFCYLCHDGGKTIELKDVLGSLEISFTCPACHEKEERAAQTKPMLYFVGFLPSILARANMPRGVYMNRARKSMNARRSLPRMLNTALEEYHNESTLCYYEIFFDFGTTAKLCRWESEAEQLATEIGVNIFEHKIIFVMVHSEVMCGDLFVGRDRNNKNMAVLPKESLGCIPQIRKEFKGGNSTSFIIAFGVHILIQGHDLYEVFNDLLDVSIELCMHSDALLFHVGERTLSRPPHSPPSLSVIGVRYSWYHTHRRPWGTTLPMSCPRCSSVCSWSESKASLDNTVKKARAGSRDSMGQGWIKHVGI
ncbi:hypothetical protein EDD17DRAFT_1512851 [Pisolithus thermaeus]|nr:hypothetical protein EDD17DRAFT_1512851 [Pisolithus thermaeus]